MCNKESISSGLKSFDALIDRLADFGFTDEEIYELFTDDEKRKFHLETKLRPQL